VLTDVPPSLYFEGAPLDPALAISIDHNRYYIPLREFVARLNGQFSTSAQTVRIDLHGLQISLNTATGDYTVNERSSRLRHRSTLVNGEVHLSLLDIQRMLGLVVVWDEDNRAIKLFFERSPLVRTQQPTGNKRALIRFEDVTSEQRYSTATALARLRVIFDYCYSRGIPMHLGWVPRYVDPSEGIDDAPAEDYSMHNANFVYTLDYFLDRNGLIGLHGYTHQYGYQTSLESSEFDGSHNTSDSSIRQRVKSAIDDARILKIPISFFESPHYASMYFQQQVFAQYFDILYEPKVSANEVKVSRMRVGDRVVTFVPTPLGYLIGAGDEENMIRRMKALSPDALGSFFYHPDIEFEFISIQWADDGYPMHGYAGSSPLHRLFDAFIGAGYTFVHVTAL
jgi:hypothetical protein